jgi:hypothetical protein
MMAKGRERIVFATDGLADIDRREEHAAGNEGRSALLTRIGPRCSGLGSARENELK